MTADLVQGSAEWLAARIGKLTASRLADAIAKTKSGWGASRANYMAELIAERLTGAAAEQYTNAAMAWGTATEPEARAAYCFRTDSDVTEVGFIPHPTIEMAGCSPDGLVGDEGLVEFKCPNTATHLETLLGGPIPAKYITQTGWQLACHPKRKWCDWVSFDPRLPEHMRLFIYRIKRDDAFIAGLERDAREFLAEVDAKVRALAEKYGQRAAA
jgi:putative phage-type endonuclease